MKQVNPRIQPVSPSLKARGQAVVASRIHISGIVVQVASCNRGRKWSYRIRREGKWSYRIRSPFKQWWSGQFRQKPELESLVDRAREGQWKVRDNLISRNERIPLGRSSPKALPDGASKRQIRIPLVSSRIELSSLRIPLVSSGLFHQSVKEWS